MSEQTLDTHRALQSIKRQQRVMTYSFLALLLFLGGFLLRYLGDSESYSWIPMLSTVMIAAGFVGYIVVRGWAIFANKKKS